jgi:hypothetical protein
VTRSDEHPDPRLDPYRGRAGELTENDTALGYLLVESDYAQLKTGGALWWTRWAPPVECVVTSLMVEGDLIDGQTYVDGELDAVLEDWAQGLHRLGPRTVRVSWLDQAASDRVHHEVFGHHH